MPTLTRFELWDTYQCEGGVRLSLLQVSEVIRCVTTERVTRDDEGVLEISKDTPSAPDVTIGHVLRLVFSDASFQEWRIRQLEDTSRTSRVVRALLQSPLMELAVLDSVVSSTVTTATQTYAAMAVDYKALSPSTVATRILAFCPTWWAIGTIEPTIPVTFTTDAYMPLRAYRELVAQIRAQGADAELTFRRNGTTGYYLDIVAEIASAEPTIDVRSGKNLLSTNRLRDRDRYALEVVPLGTTSAITGQRSTIERAYHECTVKAGTTLTIKQPVTGGDSIAYDDQLTGYYVIDDAGAAQQITDSTAGATQQIVVASAANVTQGRWYRLVRTSSSDALVRLRTGESVTGPVQVLTSAQLDDTTNFFTNPGQRVWTGASSVPADGWTTTGAGTITKTTTEGLWVYGGQSTRVQASTTLVLQSPEVSVYHPTWAPSAIFSVWFRVTTAGTGTVGFYVNTALQSSVNLSGYATGVFVRQDFTFTPAPGAAVRAFQVRVGGGSCDVYVDSVQLSWGTTAAAFLEGSNASRLWALGNRYLTTYGTVPSTYQISFANLAEWDAAAYPYDMVSVGQTATVRDVDLDVTATARVVE